MRMSGGYGAPRTLIEEVLSDYNLVTNNVVYVAPGDSVSDAITAAVAAGAATGKAKSKMRRTLNKGVN
jgi:hypothetical protein